MSLTRVLVTGGAGFIGSHIVDALMERGYEVTVLDCLDPQVHGPDRQPPTYLHPGPPLIVGDIRNREVVRAALQRIEVLIHQAAAVGIGQSMYEIERYADVNTRGTAVILDVLANEPHSVRKILVASSMSIYGEGKYHCEVCGLVYPPLRKVEQLRERDWEIRCPTCGRITQPMATSEDKPLFPNSIYAITKRDHEEMFLTFGRAYGIPAVALRYFNVYGPRQALSNPYTGVAAIFSSRLLNGHAPVIFEDGNQSRDFIHVRDVARANILAMENDAADGKVLNIGTGRAITIRRIAEILGQRLAPQIRPEITGKFRDGDIRHCYADISRARRILGFEPSLSFEEGSVELVEWVRSQQAEDRFEQADRELQRRGLSK